jgi:hypothetical protein
MQHDLKFYENRLGETQLCGWCICGRYRFQSANLSHQPMVMGFMMHLEDLRADLSD